MEQRYAVWFEETGLQDIGVVGGKNASLGEMLRALTDGGVLVPDGFATTAVAYREFLSANDLEVPIREQLDLYKGGEIPLSAAGRTIRRLFLAGKFPEEMTKTILDFYHELGTRAGIIDLPVAVRSSATAEDLPDASFAGQQETFLNVIGAEALLDACRRCFASLFTDRAISYRSVKGFDDLDVALSIGIQRMVRADAGASGVMFSLDTETGFPDAAVISATWGLGETVVQGTVNPDKYVVFKPLLTTPGCFPIIEKTRGAKERKLIYGRGGTARTRMIETTEREQTSLVLADDEILQLARWAGIIEEHYGCPMDMEWAKDGLTGELFIVQARPETVQATRSNTVFTTRRLIDRGPLLATGASIGDSIATGRACVIHDTAEIDRFRDGSILVTEMTDPDWVPIMRRAAGIVTEHGGPTSHAAIISRELGVPAVVGTGNATDAISDGMMLTISCAEGDEGHVYEGALEFETEQIDLQALPETKTSLMVNVASPSSAFKWWRLPVDGVGLARMEFIINDLIRIHPMALAEPERVTDALEVEQIRSLTRAYKEPRDYFVHTLASGLAKISAPFYPNPVIVRLSDFKSNEYARLLGGRAFEQSEENPMLGFRGASRYYNERYRQGFDLECQALKRVREYLGFRNIIIMVPFCRTVAEADRVLEVMAENGLARSEAGLQVYMMCEIPSNVILASEFATRFDGFSIGSNDLTQLVLGVDRDSELLAPLFDERDDAVKHMIQDVISQAHHAGIKIGICGQGPSNHADFAAFLVDQGIDSISLNPDTVLKTIPVIAAAEDRRDQS
ncbi:phosphoenolpyruvate synthase [Arthrobacter sulfonylureivorans]|uniref:Phosphoenolpyruvate synthase n=1 Tax=Arthrobacter sulfonylureivorans TaxID=2486855 RepID=A0ABY3W2I7_9MICC|nr:phosphoenolpyruvate synthase [Arthrobacter sulfonylureivorans]UNK44262.1 phosphoenolpyruvate synthase [Arthrobacter sulfonylureivorans]